MPVTKDEFIAAVRHGGPLDAPHDISPEDKEAALAELFPAAAPEPDPEPEPEAAEGEPEGYRNKDGSVSKRFLAKQAKEASTEARSAVTGEFVTDAEAEASPETTVEESTAPQPGPALGGPASFE